MGAKAYASPDDIDIASLWHALRRRAGRLAVFSMAAGAATFLLLSMVAPTFESEANLTIVARGAANPYTGPKQDGQNLDTVAVRMDKEAINTHVQALMSPDLASSIAKELKLAERVEFNSALGSPDRLSGLMRSIGIGMPPASQPVEDRVLKAFLDKLEVYSPKESRIVSVKFTSHDAQLAATVANTIAEHYRSALAMRTVTETDQVQKALLPEIERLTGEVAKAQAAVESFRGQANIFKGGKEAPSLNEQQLAELTAEMSKAKADRSGAEARFRSAEDLMQSGSADAVPDVQKSPLMQNLVQQRVRLERQISELSATLLPRHPRMLQLFADLKGLKSQIASEVRKVVAGLEKEVNVAALREASIASSLDEVKSRIVTTGPNEVKLRGLEAVAAAKRSELQRLQSQYEANRARAESRAVPVEVQILSRARPAGEPSAPKKTRFALLVTFAVLLFGTAITILGAFWTGARPEPSARRQADTLSGLSTVQAIPAPSVSEIRHCAARPLTMSSVPELAGRLRSRASANTGYRSLVTSALPGLDVGEVTVALARELASGECPVIVVDWNADGSGLVPNSGVEPLPGIGAILAGTATFEDAIRILPDGIAHIITFGASGANHVQDADRVNLVLDALDEAYAHIIVMARYSTARSLFELIEGRFDAGITITSPLAHDAMLRDPAGTFLGFEVADIDLLVFERQSNEMGSTRSVAQPRIAPGNMRRRV